jgi:hypothetical protein
MSPAASIEPRIRLLATDELGIVRVAEAAGRDPSTRSLLFSTPAAAADLTPVSAHAQPSLQRI